MPLLNALVPAAAVSALQARLHAWAAQPAAAPRLARSMLQAGASPEVGPAMQVFVIAPADIAGAAPMAAAKAAGWRFTMSEGSQAPLWLDVAASPAGAVDTYALSAVNQSPFHPALTSALAAAGQTAATVSIAHTPAILEIPSLYVIALWLRANGVDDVVTPIATGSSELAVGTAITPPSFVAAIQAIATAHAAAGAGKGLCP
jgi:hypothetical protein